MSSITNIIKFSQLKIILLIVLLSGSGPLEYSMSAQDIIAKLSDNEIKIIIPVLKAEIEGNKQLEKAMETKQDLAYQLFLDIRSGKTDPLEWLKQYSKNIIVPPGALYQPECSRAVSVKTGESILAEEPDFKPSAIPTAVFTFGIDFPAINKHLLGDRLTNESYSTFANNPYDATNPSVDKLRLFIKDMDSFYAKNGFGTDYSSWEFLPVATAFSFSHPEDEEHISGFVTIFDFTLLDPFYPDVIKQCSANIMGPVMEIIASQELLTQVYTSPGFALTGDDNIRKDLKDAGITEDQYALIKSSLINARRDSEYPDGIEVPSLDFVPTTQEEKEMAELIAVMRENAIARKNNITIYNKFKAELDPILDILEKWM